MAAEAWVRGSAVVVEASGGIQVSVPASGKSYQRFDEATYFPGIFSARAEAGGSALIYTSNGMTLSFRGAGHFSVERFEGLIDAATDGDGERLVETRSRMILNLRRGELLVDGRSLAADSRFIVETPFGRISSVKAVLLIRVEFDHRSEMYDFTVSCAEGVVRLRDLGGQTYSIYAGQRIAGAGSYVAPTIEAGDQTDVVREKFESFFETLEGMDFGAIDRVVLRTKMEALPDLEDTRDTSYRLTHQASPEEGKRPRVIEFAPRADAVTPFRGDVKPPSDFQADIF
jgi:hypothetical protein